MGRLLTVLLAIWGLGQEIAADVPAHPKILVYGDSLSAGYGIDRADGWVELLASRLTEQDLPHALVNASISGETTTGGLSRLDAVLAEHEPDIVILELGGNDGLQGLPLQLIERNLNRMLDLIEDAGAQPLLIGMQIPPNLGPIYTERFTALYPTIAEQRDVPLVPRFLEQVAVDKTLMQDDGIHPTAAGQPRLLEKVWPHLRRLLNPGEADGTASG